MLIRLPHLWPAPRRNVGAASCDVVARSSATPRTPSAISTRSLSSLPEFSHQTGILGVETSFGHGARRAGRGRRSIRIPVNLAVTRHVAGATAHTTDDISSEVALFRAIIFTMTKATAILTDLIFVITKGTIQSGKLAELVALVIVLSFWGGGRLQHTSVMKVSSRVEKRTHRLDHSIDHLHTSCYLVLRISDDETMQVFFSIIGVLIWSCFTLLHAAFATDADLSTALPFHLLQ